MAVEHLFLRISFGLSKLSKLFKLTLTTSSHDSASSYAYSAYLNAPYDSLALPYLISIVGDLILFIKGAACLNILRLRYKVAAFSNAYAFS